MIDLSSLISKESDKQVKALAEMEKRLDKRSVVLQKELYAIIRDKFLDSLSRDEKGKLLYNTSNLNRVNDMAATWEYFRESKMRPEMLEFGKDLMSIVDVEAGYFMALGKEFDIPFEFDKVKELISKQIGLTLDRNPAIIPDSYLDRLLQGSQVQDKVTNIVLENVSAKASFSKLKADLSEVIMGNEEVNGAMTKYLRTYAYDTFSVVQRTVDLNMADTYGMNCFVYEGNLIKDSREFCQQHLGEIICREQFPDFEAQDWQGKNPDVPFEVALGGYNCRHNPMWIPDEAKEYLETKNNDNDILNGNDLSVSEIDKNGNKLLSKSDLSEVDKYAIDRYQNGRGYYKETNTFLRTGQPYTIPGDPFKRTVDRIVPIDETIKKIEQTENALIKLPKYEGKLFRGTGIDDDVYRDLMSQIKDGYFSDKAFGAFSYDKNIAEMFMSDRFMYNNLVEFEVNAIGKNGSFIGNTIEHEIVFRPGVRFEASFEVYQREIHGQIRDITKIILNEVER